jgi:hypothetical protein
MALTAKIQKHKREPNQNKNKQNSCVDSKLIRPGRPNAGASPGEQLDQKKIHQEK